MIDNKQVITMKIPFPTISEKLATSPHMYICIMKTNDDKKFVKCQTLKPYHLGKNKKPYYKVIEKSDINRNPFKRMTLVDCDKHFLTSGVEICSSLLTKRRKDICDELFNDVNKMSNHSSLKEHQLDRDSLIKLNEKIKIRN